MTKHSLPQAELKKLLPDGMRKQAQSTWDADKAEEEELEAEKAKFTVAKPSDVTKEEKQAFEKKKKKLETKIGLRKARWETLNMMTDEQRECCLDELQILIFVYEQEAEWQGRLQPEMGVDTTPEELYQILKGVGSMPRIPLIPAFLFSSNSIDVHCLWRHIQHGGALLSPHWSRPQASLHPSRR